MLTRLQVQDALSAGNGVLRLEPCWVPRTFMQPGRRLRLHPDDVYALGAHRGGINERWFASTTNADNGPGTPPDEGLSYVRLESGERFQLKHAVDVAGDALIGAGVMSREGGWNVLCKFFDNMGPIPHHMHQADEHARLVGRKGKPEAYYFPPQYNQIDNDFPYTFMGLEPGTTKDDILRCLENWGQGDNGILYLSKAYRLQVGTGWQIDPGILHAPGSLVTYEPQVNSDVFGMFQSLVDGRVVPRDLLVKDVPRDKHDDLDFIVGMLDWEANVNPNFGRDNRVSPKAVRPVPDMETDGYREHWVCYGTRWYSASTCATPMDGAHPPRWPDKEASLTTKPLNIGLVGYGFMGRTHSNAFLQAAKFFELPYRPVLKAVAARNRERVEAFAANWGYQSAATDWRRLVERADIDLIDIASPNDTHAEIAMAAASAGKMVMCEKPLARSAAEAEGMVNAVEKAGVPNSVWYNYRRVPAVVLLRHLLDEGRLGRIFHYRAKFLQDWTISEDVPQGGEGLWRLDATVAGSGVTGDLLAHCIDTALWLNGPIDEVTAMTETFVRARKHNLTGRVEPVGIDDACAFLSRFRNGALATFESTRYARGHKALYTLEINGERASAAWDLHDLHRLQWFDHGDEGRTRGWRSIHITDGDHPYMKHWWVPGLQIGYEHTFIHQFADFCRAAADGKSAPPTFRDGLATDYVTDAVLASARSGRWETVAPLDRVASTFGFPS